MNAKLASSTLSKGNVLSQSQRGFRPATHTGFMTVQSARRWERRLEQLKSLEDEDGGQPPTPWTVARARQVLYILDDAGANTTKLRLFLTHGGAIEIQRRNGKQYRTLEIDDTELTLHDVDLTKRTSTSRRVSRPAAAAEALAAHDLA